jgi:hypothetical protein
MGTYQTIGFELIFMTWNYSRPTRVFFFSFFCACGEERDGGRSVVMLAVLFLPL